MEHTRIDEGVPRPTSPQAPIERKSQRDYKHFIPAELDPDEVIERYLTEHTTSKIAESYGIRRHALVRWLREHRPKEWKEAQKIRAFCTKEDGEGEVYDATTALSLARARELIRSGQWDLQALDEDYMPKQEVSVKEDLNVTIDVHLSVEARSLLDQLRTVSSLPQTGNAALLQADPADIAQSVKCK